MNPYRTQGSAPESAREALKTYRVEGDGKLHFIRAACPDDAYKVYLKTVVPSTIIYRDSLTFTAVSMTKGNRTDDMLRTEVEARHFRDNANCRCLGCDFGYWRAVRRIFGPCKCSDSSCTYCAACYEYFGPDGSAPAGARVLIMVALVLVVVWTIYSANAGGAP